MHRLDELIDHWVGTLGKAEPALKPHLEEIADHVRTDAHARAAAGAEMSDAFAAAVGSFGAPRALATEFLKPGPNEERAAVRLVIGYLAVVLVLTAAMVAVDKLVTPLDATSFGLVWVFILNPLLLLAFLRRFVWIGFRTGSID
jgi:hypothetical protein